MSQPHNISRSKSKSIVGPREGYRLVSPVYEKWHWFHFWRRNESPLVKEWLASLDPGLFLDVGSGTGMYKADLQEAGHRSVSIDISMEMLEIQRNKLSRPTRHCSPSLVQGDIHALPFARSSFDYLLCTRVLSHVRSVRPIFAEYARVTKPDAELLISDVHPLHCYTEMSLDRNDQKISIQIYKHTINELQQAFQAASFEFLRLEEFGLEDLEWKPAQLHFEKIYDNPGVPIFYICWLRNASAPQG